MGAAKAGRITAQYVSMMPILLMMTKLGMPVT